MITYQQATPDHARQMSALLRSILLRWNSPRPFEPDHIRSQYIDHPNRLSCAVALNGQQVVGFQSLQRAGQDNVFDVTPGWGIIGTYVAEGMGGRGIGRSLFAVSLSAARAADLPAIDATIADWNDEGQAYYKAMGFSAYRTRPGSICRKYTL